MTDRAQPGAIDSIIRNDELGEALAPFLPGSIIPGSDPSNIAQRRSGIDDGALNGFDISVSSSSLDVTVDAGEAYVAGWCCRDVSTTLTLPPDTTSEILVGWNANAIYDPEVDADRDAADEVIVDLASNVDDDLPTTVAWEVTTDGSGVTGTTRVAPVGALSVSELTTEAVAATEVKVEKVPSVNNDVIRKSDFDEVTRQIGNFVASFNDHSAQHLSGGSDPVDAGALPVFSPTQIFTTTTDPSADVGEIWYRTDLD